MDKRTDMAIELSNGSRRSNGKIVRTDIDLDENTAKRYGKAPGKYITIECDAVKTADRDYYKRLSNAIGDVVDELGGKASNVLVVGLGNPKLTADSLGSKVFDRLVVTRQFESAETQISGICPNVMGVTGIESFDVIKGVCERVSPDLVIAVDSLASATTGRIASAFQVCSSGITPGSGVSNHRMRLNRESLGCQVISLGVPLVVYASTIISEAVGDAEVSGDISDLIVTPKDIDFLVEECADVIAAAINRTFCSF
ncbi:MAG: GPR endopeptidase [Clostridiales bacterium]|nr:GPR endopeptidase [Clostridiales bacterium]